MDQAIIARWWEQARRASAGSLAASFSPFPRLPECLADLGLKPLPSIRSEPPTPVDIDSVEPAFKNLTDEFVLALRHHAEAGTQTTTVAAWAEKLLRFCEVRHHTLRARTLKSCPQPAVAQRRMLHVAAFLTDEFLRSGDLRLLNTVLKLADLKWICRPRALDKALASSANDSSALLQLRLILATEYALHRMRKDVAV